MTRKPTQSLDNENTPRRKRPCPWGRQEPHAPHEGWYYDDSRDVIAAPGGSMEWRTCDGAEGKEGLSDKPKESKPSRRYCQVWKEIGGRIKRTLPCPHAVWFDEGFNHQGNPIPSGRDWRCGGY